VYSAWGIDGVRRPCSHLLKKGEYHIIHRCAQKNSSQSPNITYTILLTSIHNKTAHTQQNSFCCFDTLVWPKNRTSATCHLPASANPFTSAAPGLTCCKSHKRENYNTVTSVVLVIGYKRVCLVTNYSYCHWHSLS